MKQQDELELEYLRFFYDHVNLGENEDDIKCFINSQCRAFGVYIPIKYDVYGEE